MPVKDTPGCPVVPVGVKSGAHVKPGGSLTSRRGSFPILVELNPVQAAFLPRFLPQNPASSGGFV
jgi:hypothetical protein